ncbi:adenylosuccinate synthase [Candidatus Curtissbacteria bacterium]|nr:adenylosuccinate synthase [Candidatus Curtissbacteria bacterium]
MASKSLKNWQGIACVIGLDFGDSGKGRLIDDLAQNAHIVARFNGGSNAGHTVRNQFGAFALHMIPSGIFNQKATCIIGRGVAVDLESLIDDEFQQLKKVGVSWKNLIIDDQATLTMPWHKLKDGIRENYRKTKIGTVGKGIGPTYADRVERSGLRVYDLIAKDFREKLADELSFQNKFFNLKLKFENIFSQYAKYATIIKSHVATTIPVIKKAKKDGKNILFEGAQGYFLDIDSGTYPYVTSSSTGVLGIWRSFDIHPFDINQVVGITKAYLTRVGAGPMPTKINSHEKETIIEKGTEFGTTSGRVRDPGWLDLVLIKHAVAANKVNSLALTKLDILSGFKNIKICIGYKIASQVANYVSGDATSLEKCQPQYEVLPGWRQDISKARNFKDLPKNAKNYIKFIEKFTQVPVNIIGVGPEREQAIYV